MNKELISIIVPVYNVEMYLERCITSIINQTYTNIEIILVDDGSPDSCPRLCDEWAKKDERIIVIHKKNGGLSDARNAGLEIAKGEYIAFVDSDDYINEAMIEKLYQALALYNTDIAVCGIKRTDGVNYNILPVYYDSDMGYVTSEQALKDILTNKCTIAAWNKLYRKTSIGNTRFIFGRYNEDVPFLFELLNKELSVSYLTTPLYNYYCNSNGITGKFSDKLLDGLKNAIEIFDSIQTKVVSYRKECIEYLDRNVIGAIRMIILNHAIKQFPDQCEYCKKYAIANLFRLLMNSNYTYKMKMWLLLAIIKF